MVRQSRSSQPTSVLNHEHKGILYYPGDAVLLKNDMIGMIYNIQTTKLGITALVHEFTDQEKLLRLEFRGKKLNYEIAENELLYNTGGASEVFFKDFVRKVQVSNKESSEYFCKRAIDIDRGNVFNVSWDLVERGLDLVLDSPKKNSSPPKSKVQIVMDDETMVDSIDEISDCQDEGKETVDKDGREEANETSSQGGREGGKQTSDEEFQEFKESSGDDQDVKSEDVKSEDEKSEDFESVASSEESQEVVEVDSDDTSTKFRKGTKRKPRGSRMDKIRRSAKPVIKKKFKFKMDDIRESRKLPPHATIYQKARERLYLSYTPESLPCREKEFDEIYMFLEELIEARSGACIYISGVPGTGKTATVYSVMNAFQKQMQEKVCLHLLKFRKYPNVS
jgi:hypothetical protein